MINETSSHVSWISIRGLCFVLELCLVLLTWNAVAAFLEKCVENLVRGVARGVLGVLEHPQPA